MTKERDDSSVRASGGDPPPTTALWRQREPHAAGRGMLTRSLNPGDALPRIESLRALDWLNFFLAALLMGFGPFVTVHLAENGWAPASIGAILTIGGLAGLMTQVPAGELIDMIGSKRALFG